MNKISNCIESLLANIECAIVINFIILYFIIESISNQIKMKFNKKKYPVTFEIIYFMARVQELGGLLLSLTKKLPSSPVDMS
jgi:hypothetical protein